MKSLLVGTLVAISFSYIHSSDAATLAEGANYIDTFVSETQGLGPGFGIVIVGAEEVYLNK
ncbi:hypothetical protein ACFSW6_22060, partial [Comamonas terrae]